MATADDLLSTDRASSPRNTRRRVFPGRRKPYPDAESLASRTLVLAHREPMPHRVPTCSAPASRGPHTTDRGTHHGRVLLNGQPVQWAAQVCKGLLDGFEMPSPLQILGENAPAGFEISHQ